MDESHWKMMTMIETIDAFISTEERINEMVSKTLEASDRNELPWKQTSTVTVPIAQKGCMFCNSSEHRAVACPRYRTIAERRNFLLEKNMCLNCGREGHWVKDCSREGCRTCQGKKHNQVLCPERVGAPTKKQDANAAVKKPTPAQKKCAPSQPTKSTKHVPAKVMRAHPVLACTDRNSAIDCDPQGVAMSTETIAARSNHASARIKEDNVFLLTGMGKIRSMRENEWQTVEILFDTGADQSYINQTLAENLGLLCNERKQLKIYTFGSTLPTTAICGITQAEISDNLGESHFVRLHVIPVLTGRGTSMHLTSQDLEFITANK
ncbi:zinc knuckle, partial [Ostertagia ostertagi]